MASLASKRKFPEEDAAKQPSAKNLKLKPKPKPAPRAPSTPSAPRAPSAPSAPLPEPKSQKKPIELKTRDDPAFVLRFYNAASVLLPAIRSMMVMLESVEFTVVHPSIPVSKTQHDSMWDIRREGEAKTFTGIKIDEMDSANTCIMFTYLAAEVIINPLAVEEPKELWSFRMMLSNLNEGLKTINKEEDLVLTRRFGEAEVTFESSSASNHLTLKMSTIVQDVPDFQLSSVDYQYAVSIDSKSFSMLTSGTKNKLIPCVRIRLYKHKTEQVMFFIITLQNENFILQSCSTSKVDTDNNDEKMVVINSSEKQRPASEYYARDVEEVFHKLYPLDYFRNILKSFQSSNSITMRLGNDAPAAIINPLSENLSFMAYLIMDKENDDAPIPEVDIFRP